MLSFVKVDSRISTMNGTPPWLTRAMVKRRPLSNASPESVLISGQIEKSIRADPSRARPDLKNAPRCRKCKGTTSRKMVRSDNAIGNGGRPYYRRDCCQKFSCFGDMRGIHDANPTCRCSPRRRSRAALNRRWDENHGGRAVRFRCAFGNCGFDKFGGVYKERGERLRVQDVVRAGL